MERRTLLKAGALAPAALLATPAAPASAALSVTTLARRLDTPWGIAFLPGGDALVTERDSGWITRVRRTGGRHRIARVPGVVSAQAQGGESGLLGIALHPDFASNRWVYVYLTTARDNRVVRMRFRDGAFSRPDPVVTGLPRSLHHNGGGLVFGPQNLYISVGDAEDRSAPQNRGRRGGKILRVTPSGRAVATNPFGNRVWTYGHRNPEGLAFDRRGELWASEFGQNTWDELNRIVKGRNYGWPRQEGKDGGGGFRDPLTQWHPDNCSPSGIAVARGRAWLGALRGESLWSVVLHGPDRGRRTRHFEGRFGRIRAVAAAPDGSLWIGTSNRDGRGSPGATDDRILRVRLG